MKIAVFCILFTATLLRAATTQPLDLVPDQPEEQAVHLDQHKIDKRFIGTMMLMDALLDDDDYFDEFPLGMRPRRPSRRTVQLAQMLRQLAGPQGLTRAQLQNMQQNLQSLQTLQNLQQMQQLQGLQGLQQMQQLQGLQSVQQGAQPQSQPQAG